MMGFKTGSPFAVSPWVSGGSFIRVNFCPQSSSTLSRESPTEIEWYTHDAAIASRPNTATSAETTTKTIKQSAIEGSKQPLIWRLMRVVLYKLERGRFASDSFAILLLLFLIILFLLLLILLIILRRVTSA